VRHGLSSIGDCYVDVEDPAYHSALNMQPNGASRRASGVASLKQGI